MRVSLTKSEMSKLSAGRLSNYSRLTIVSLKSPRTDQTGLGHGICHGATMARAVRHSRTSGLDRTPSIIVASLELVVHDPCQVSVHAQAPASWQGSCLLLSWHLFSPSSRINRSRNRSSPGIKYKAAKILDCSRSWIKSPQGASPARFNESNLLSTDGGEAGWQFDHSQLIAQTMLK